MNSQETSQPCVAHLQLLPLLTGVQTVTLTEFAHLDRAAFRPVLICKQPGPLAQASEGLGVEVRYIPSLVRHISPLVDLKSLGHLIVQLRRIRPDILHTHSSKTGILGRLAGRLAGVPAIVHTVHGFAFPYARSPLTRMLYYALEYVGGKLCDSVVVLTESDRKITVQRLKVPAHKVRLIPNAVDVRSFQRAGEEDRARLRREIFGVVDDNAICVGMVGRLWRQKNPICLVEAARRAVARNSLIHIFFIGDGELRPEIERTLKTHRLEDRVRVLGWRTDVPRVLSALDMFVLPSLWEGMPLALLEAMASSLPVIASNVSGNRDLIDHGVDGLLFASGDEEQLADALIRLSTSATQRSEMGRRARLKIEKNHALTRRVEVVSAMYAELLTDVLAPRPMSSL
jgi:glycosyltransferase involved in cell wall biosynthesis